MMNGILMFITTLTRLSKYCTMAMLSSQMAAWIGRIPYWSSSWKLRRKKYKIRIHNCEKKNQIKYIYFGNSNLEVQYGPCVVLEKGLYVLSILIDKLQHFAIQIYFSLYNIYLPWKKKKWLFNFTYIFVSTICYQVFQYIQLSVIWCIVNILATFYFFVYNVVLKTVCINSVKSGECLFILSHDRNL